MAPSATRSPKYEMLSYDHLLKGVLNERVSKSKVKAMSDRDRHELLKFIHDWLAGSYMADGESTPRGTHDPMEMWKKIAAIFPASVPGDLPLYRLVTVPKANAADDMLTFKPARGKLSSWSSTLTGVDCVAGVAREFSDEHKTARVAINTMIPGSSIIATPKSIKEAFLTLSHDYMDRYRPKDVSTTQPDGRTLWREVPHQDWPGYPDDGFDYHDVDYAQDLTSRRGGWMRQYEYVVITPPTITAKVVRVYRVGTHNVRYGNDSPNG